MSLSVLFLLVTVRPGFCRLNSPDPGNKTEIKGTPRTLHFTLKDFNGDPQFWAVCQDEEGILYFGNNDGVLIFDGSSWQKVFLPNKSSVRSLLYKDSYVYVGGFNEFGRLAKDQYGGFSFSSLTDRLRPEELDFENIWAIHHIEDNIVFRSSNRLFALSDNKVFTIPVNGVSYSTEIDGQLYLVDPEGLKKLDIKAFEFQTLAASKNYQNAYISAILEGDTNEQLLLITQDGAMLGLNLKTLKIRNRRRFFSKESNNQILSALKSSGGNIYLGTLTSQIIILTNSGQRNTIENSFLRLQDNTVLNLFESDEGNIWALLNNGLDCINISSPVSILYQNVSVFDVMIHGGKVHVATNQNALRSEQIADNPNFSSLSFQKVPGLEGQVWSLQSLQDKVIYSHDRGLFISSGKQTSRLADLTGVWKVIPVRSRPDHYLVCTYEGIYVIRYRNSEEFELLHKIDGFDESSRDILEGNDDGVFWVCHGYKGVFKIRIDKALKTVVSLEHYRESGLPSPFSINVFRWQGEIVFTTNQGIYTYNADKNLFEHHHKLTEVFGTKKNVRKLIEFEDKTWFVHDDEVGYFNTDDMKPHKGLFLELKGTFNRGMECIVPINKDNVMIGTNTGLYAYDLSFKSPDFVQKTLLTKVSYAQEDTILRCPLDPETIPSISHKASQIRFEFSAPKLKDKANIHYSYQLDGIDHHWSEWTEATYKEYTKLFPGEYTFQVRARSTLGESAQTASYTLTILPAWYRTPFAYGLYLLLIGLFLLVSKKLVKTKISDEKEKTRSEERETRKVLELQIQQLKLEKEKERIERDKQMLEVDVVDKSKELANYTMLLVKKRELITELREELKKLKELSKNEKSRNLVRNLVRKIGIHLNDEEHIKVFETNFERVHHEFYSELKNHYPDLNAKELRLCALVRMNLTNKEIAPLLNISIRGVETARYRLRKRLSLDQEENMVEFLEKLSPS